jgi:hypothetical protein
LLSFILREREEGGIYIKIGENIPAVLSVHGLEYIEYN